MLNLTWSKVKIFPMLKKYLLLRKKNVRKITMSLTVKAVILHVIQNVNIKMMKTKRIVS